MYLLLGRKTKRNCPRCFHAFLQVFERGVLQTSPILTGRNGRLKPGKLLNLVKHIGNEKDNFHYHCFDIQGATLFQKSGLFIEATSRKACYDNFTLQRLFADFIV